MPTNKKALLRYQVLDRCFSDFSHRYEISDLLQKVNEALYDLYGTEIQMRQIRDDIKYMRDRVTYNAPIVAIPYDGKRCYYRYKSRNFSIFNNELSVEEVNSLRSTIEMLGRYRGGVTNAWLEEVISNLEYRFGIKSNNENIVSFEHNDQLKGLEYLSDLIDSASNHQPLKIQYRTFKGVERTSIVHPYHLKQYNNRWFLFGLEESEKYGNHITNMALDRIVAYSRPADVIYIPNRDIDFSTFFDDVIGVTIPNEDVEKIKVVLQFSKNQFPYIASKPLHHSQQIIDAENGTLSIEVRPNYELNQMILGFGSDVEVLEPESFRQEIIEIICKNLQKYNIVQIDRTGDN